MAGSFVFEAELRTSVGRGDARRIRQTGKVPAILYGGMGEPVGLVLDHNKVIKALENEAVYSHILNLKIDDREEQAILKDLQRHPSKPLIMHMDFLRISATEKIRVHVPLHFIHQEISIGAKKGGVVTHNLADVEVVCLPDKLPEFLEVDLANVDLGQSVHLSEIKLPEGVDIVALLQGLEHDIPVAVIQLARSSESTEGEG